MVNRLPPRGISAMNRKFLEGVNRFLRISSRAWIWTSWSVSLSLDAMMMGAIRSLRSLADWRDALSRGGPFGSR